MQCLSQHLSSTLPLPPAHSLISHFSCCLPYPWSDLHRSSAPQVSPPREETWAPIVNLDPHSFPLSLPKTA